MTTPGSGYKLVVVGSVALDSVEAPAGKHDDVLGGSASFFSVAASYFTRPHLVAVVGSDFPPEHIAFLGDRGVDLAGLERAEGRTFRWAGRYAKDLASRTTLDTQLNVFAGFQPKLPESYRDAELLFLGNIHPSLQLDVLRQVRAPKLVAMDTMNFWIDPAEGKLDALKQVLARVDLLVINDEEARLLAGLHNLPRAARAIRAMGPKTVVVKRGDSGALIFYGGSEGHGPVGAIVGRSADGASGEARVFAAPAYPLEEVVDPTGAGDTFAGGFMGYLAMRGDLAPATIRRAMIYGSVMASFSVEAFSLDRLRKLTREAIEERYRAFCDLTHFEEVRIA